MMDVNKGTQKPDMFTLTKRFWKWAAENPEKVKPAIVAVYFSAVELCNKLGWPDKFGIPTDTTRELTGISSRTTYTKVFNELVENGLVMLIRKSPNQHKSTIIAFPKNEQARFKNPDTAVSKNEQAHIQAREQQRDGTDTIIKPLKTDINFKDNINNADFLKKALYGNEKLVESLRPTSQHVDGFIAEKLSTRENLKWKEESDFYKHFRYWVEYKRRLKDNSAPEFTTSTMKEL